MNKTKNKVYEWQPRKTNDWLKSGNLWRMKKLPSTLGLRKWRLNIAQILSHYFVYINIHVMRQNPFEDSFFFIHE